MQDSKGGFVDNMQGTGQVIGMRRAINWIEKATWTLAGGIFVLSLVNSSSFRRLL